MALARFHWGCGSLEYASIGNIEARVISQSKPYNFIVRRGIIGLNAPEPKVNRHEWSNDNVLLLISDGIASHWSWQDFPEFDGQPANKIAQGLLYKLAKDVDDATALVVKQASHE